MNRAQAVTVVAVALALLLASAGPARADEPDVTAPTVASTGLRDGQLVPVSLNFTPVLSDDVAVTKVQLILDGKIVNTYLVDASWKGRLQLNPGAALHDRDADVTVRAFDKAGNRGEATTRVHVDTESPDATITPASATKIGGTVTFAVTSSSPDLAGFAVYDDRANLLTRATQAPWIATWDSRGTNRMLWGEIVIRDRAGNIDSSYTLLDVDNTGPLIYHTRFPAVDGHLGGRSKSITTSLVDYTGVQRVEWWTDGTLRATTLNPGDATTLSWDTTGIPGGTAALQIRAYDVFGAVSTLERTVTIDNRVPSLSVTPADKALLRTGFTTTAKAGDPAGLGAATLTIDGGKHGRHTLPAAPFTRKIATKLTDGRHTLTWSIPDKLGNTGALTRSVTVDNTAATLKVTKAPRDGAKVKKTVTVTAAASDRNGVKRVELLVNGKVVATDTKAGYTFTITIKKSYGKKMRIRLRAYDNAGNSTNTATRTWHR
jgi:hypothetical protein